MVQYDLQQSVRLGTDVTEEYYNGAVAAKFNDDDNERFWRIDFISDVSTGNATDRVDGRRRMYRACI
jgi:hypothetical protein